MNLATRTRLKRRLARAGVTYADVAKRAGVTYRMVQFVMAGQRTSGPVMEAIDQLAGIEKAR